MNLRSGVSLALLLATWSCAPSGSLPGGGGALRPDEAASPSPVAVASVGFEVVYLANEGFLVEANGRRVLVDGLFGEGINGYPAVPAELRRQLETGSGPWGSIDVAIASHYHGDHFDPAAVGRFLESNPDASFVSTPQAIERLTNFLTEGGVQPAALLERARPVLPAEGAMERIAFDGIDIDVLALHHGRRDPPIENLGLVVRIGDQSFLHFGDTEAKMESFEPYLDLLRGTDLALLPFWFLSSEWRAAMVRDLIQPRWIMVGHMPAPDAPASYFGRWSSYDELARAIKTAFPEARNPTRPGESFRFEG